MNTFHAGCNGYATRVDCADELTDRIGLGRAANEGIAAESGRATANGAPVASLAQGVGSANAVLANVDAARAGALLRIAALVIPVIHPIAVNLAILNSTSSDWTRFHRFGSKVALLSLLLL